MKALSHFVERGRISLQFDCCIASVHAICTLACLVMIVGYQNLVKYRCSEPNSNGVY